MIALNHPGTRPGQGRSLDGLLVDELFGSRLTFDDALPILGRAEGAEGLRLVAAVTSDLYAEFVRPAYLDTRLQVPSPASMIALECAKLCQRSFMVSP